MPNTKKSVKMGQVIDLFEYCQRRGKKIRPSGIKAYKEAYLAACINIKNEALIQSIIAQIKSEYFLKN